MPSVIMQNFDSEGIPEEQCCIFNFNTYVGLINFVLNYEYVSLLEETKLSAIKMYDVNTKEVIINIHRGEINSEFNGTYFRNLSQYIDNDELRASLLLSTQEKTRIIAQYIKIPNMDYHEENLTEIDENNLLIDGNPYLLSSITDYYTLYSDSNILVFFTPYSSEELYYET